MSYFSQYFRKSATTWSNLARSAWDVAFFTYFVLFRYLARSAFRVAEPSG